MKRVLMLTGDVNLMNVTDPEVPFARMKDTLRQADVLFGNLESCFYKPATGHPVEPGQADFLRPRQLLVSHRAWRPGPR